MIGLPIREKRILSWIEMSSSLAGLGEIAFAFARQLFKQWAVGVGADGQGEEPGLSLFA